MTWLSLAQCDNCGALSDIGQTRTTVARALKREGWTKGGRPLRIYCPDCQNAAQKDRAARKTKTGGAA